MKGRSQPSLCYIGEENRAVIPTGITFVKHLNGNNILFYFTRYAIRITIVQRSLHRLNKYNTIIDMTSQR